MTEQTDRRDEEMQVDAGAGEPEAAAAADADASSGTDLGGEVEELRDELATLNDRHLRLAAEFDNYRKRSERDRDAMMSRLQADLVAALLDVVDDLERVAATGGEASAQSLAEGIRLVEKKFIGILEGAGLDPVDAEGQPFDPERMEALMTVPTDDPDQDHLVADVFQRGYRFRDRLLRPARVRVFQYEEQGE